MRRTAFLLGLLSSALLFSCGPLLGQKKVEYVPDYTLKGLPDNVYIWKDKDTAKKWGWVKFHSETVHWVAYKRETDLMRGTIIQNTYSIGDWELEIVGTRLKAVHVPTGREYTLKLRNPFPMQYRAVAKVVGDKLYVKEAIDGRTFVIDPRREIKEVGTIPRAYLFDDGIVIVGGDRIKFCDYGMEKCRIIDRIKRDGYSKGSYGRFYRLNGYFVFFRRAYEKNTKTGQYEWDEAWLIKTEDGKLVDKLYSTVSCQKWKNYTSYYEPFREDVDKQYVYRDDDYYLNPHYKDRRQVPVSYRSVAAPPIYIDEKGRVYLYCENGNSFKSDWLVYRKNGKEIWRKEVNAWLYYDGFGFCGKTPLFEADEVYYNPEDGKKVKCEGTFVKIW